MNFRFLMSANWINQPALSKNVLLLVKGDDRYFFLYDESRRDEVLRKFGRFAANPELNFTWYDAAVLSQKVRDQIIE